MKTRMRREEGGGRRVGVEGVKAEKRSKEDDHKAMIQTQKYKEKDKKKQDVKKKKLFCET